MKYTDSGTLTVRTYTAGGALPVENTVVRVSGVDENNRFVEFSVLTDADGITQKITLPSPSISYSLSPSAQEIPYAVYDVEVSHDGYYTKTIKNVAIFSGTNSNQPINMIPISVTNGGADYPRGNLNALITENEML